MLKSVARFSLAAVLVLSAAPPARSQEAHHATVQSDRIAIGPEYVPRRTDLPAKLIVPAGKTVELPEDATYDYIEVAGTLRVSREHDTQLKFTHLINLPGGTIDAGTQADPIPCDRRLEFIIRNVPLDTTKDPFQWGNGLVNFGRQSRVGCRKTAFLEATDGLAAGATRLTLASAPLNWRVGDELLIPDTAQPSPMPRREAAVTIAAINGAELTLSKGLDFAHSNITDPNGVVILRPRVVNLTRNIVVRSEEGLGQGVTRGHTVDIGMTARWDIRYNQFAGLGRTLNVTLKDTVPGGAIGSNQRGKYAEHHHHAESSVGSADVGNTYLGNRATTKWALVVHGTSDTLVEDNVVVDFPGAGFVTEDGYEVRNVFRHNLAAYIGGDPGHSLGFDGRNKVAADCPGCDGSGFWIRGVMNTFEKNEAWNNYRGINLFNQQQLDGKYAKVPGTPSDTANDKHTLLPVVMTGNVAAANALAGYEFWGMHRFPNDDLISAYNRGFQIMGVLSDGIDHWYRNARLICQQGSGSIGVHASMAYTASFQMGGGEIAGCSIGIAGGGGVQGMNLTGTVLQNVTNIDMLPQLARFEDVKHVPLGSNPHRYILFNNDGNGGSKVWNGTDPLPRVGISTWIPQRGSRLVIRNWQGTGEDYLLFYRQQLGSNPAWYSGLHQHMYNTPVKGLTMQQSWEQFGLAYGGGVLKESEAVQLDGIVEGYAKKGLDVALGPPRAVVTFPTMREPALGPDERHPSVTGYVRIVVAMTGDPNAASNVLMVSIDGETMKNVPGNGEEGVRSDGRVFNTSHASPGVHTVKVWRTKKDGSPLPGSEYTSQYVVSPAPPAPTSGK